MKNVKDLRITGIDASRPPRIRKEPYIDLVFKLSDRVTKEWCQDFTALFSNEKYSVKIDPVDCMYIETWVRTMDEIPGHLELLQAKVTECNLIVLNRETERLRQVASGNAVLQGEDGAQGELNRIIANLDFK